MRGDYPIQHNTTADRAWREKSVEPGTCFKACVAGLADVPYIAVPNFAGDWRPGPGWWVGVREWARARGRDFLYAEAGTDHAAAMIAERREGGDGLVIAGGRTIRDTQHVVLWDVVADRMVHDPHPSGAGLLAVDEYFWLCDPYDPDPVSQYLECLNAAEETA